MRHAARLEVYDELMLQFFRELHFIEVGGD